MIELRRSFLLLGLLKTFRALLTNQDILRQILSQWLISVDKAADSNIHDDANIVTDNGLEILPSQVSYHL